MQSQHLDRPLSKTSTNLVRMDASSLPIVWEVVRERLQRVIEKNHILETSVEIVLSQVQSGNAQLWLVMEGEKVRSLVVTEIRQYPLGRSLNFTMGEGHLHDALSEHLHVMEQWAYNVHGAERTEALARPGLAKFLTKELGFEKAQVRVTKTIDRALN